VKSPKDNFDVADAVEYFGIQTLLLVLHTLSLSAMLLNILESQNGNNL
jgi:hypothetical protein